MMQIFDIYINKKKMENIQLNMGRQAANIESLQQNQQIALEEDKSGYNKSDTKVEGMLEEAIAPIRRKKKCITHTGEDIANDISSDTVNKVKTTGKWTKFECEQFNKAFKQYGKNWKKVTDCIPTRSQVQVRSHAQKYFLKLDQQKSKENEMIAIIDPLETIKTPENAKYISKNVEDNKNSIIENTRLLMVYLEKTRRDNLYLFLIYKSNISIQENKSIRNKMFLEAKERIDNLIIAMNNIIEKYEQHKDKILIEIEECKKIRGLLHKEYYKNPIAPIIGATHIRGPLILH